MSDSKIKTGYRGVDRRAPRPAPGSDGAGAYGEVMNRRAKIGGRHSAITNDLYNWHSYKNWAERMRGSWDEKK